MILSVSRRTDIPSYYSDWFFNRLKEGFVYTRNPMKPHQVSRLTLSPDVVDCMVFWTKNPQPMLGRLAELEPYPYFFQFTLTGYGTDVETNVPNKKNVMIPIFQKLSEKIGSKRVIWRYDPILFSGVYTKEYHLQTFAQIAEALQGYTERCVISFVDRYAKNLKNMEALKTYDLGEQELREFAAKLGCIAHRSGMSIATCAENINLEDCGIQHSSCIDKTMVEDVIGCKIKASKDRNQRKECGCIESVDIGTYNTCRNGCKYCYANHSEKSVVKNSQLYDVHSPLLCSRLTEEDIITERKLKSLLISQMCLW